MATGDDTERYSYSFASEDLSEVKCGPCHENGQIRDAVGLCVDCQDYLCQRCFDCHTVPKPCRNHELLDKQQMLKSQVPFMKRDKCTEKCTEHEEKDLKYYCKHHCKLACSICINLDHRTCEEVLYIPRVAKDLASNKEYQQTESQMKELMEKCKRNLEDAKQNAKTLENSCSEAVKMVREFKKDLVDALDKVEAQLVEKAETIKLQQLNKMTKITKRYQRTQQELQATAKQIEAFQDRRQNCNSYIIMMKTKEKLKLLDDMVEGTQMDWEQIYSESQLKFVSNRGILDTLQNPGTFGSLTEVGTGTILQARHVQDINVKIDSDKETCYIAGSAFLPDYRLLITDWKNENVKVVDVRQGQIVTQMKLLSAPWDITMIIHNQVAVSLINSKKIAFITAANTMSVDRTLSVNGDCRGVDYRDGRLAVSYIDPDKVEVLDLQGSVLYSITTDKQGQKIFRWPSHVTFARDNTVIYVSNFWNDNVVCVRLDETLVATYTVNKINYPRGVATDSSGNVYVCAQGSNNIHQISSDCKMIKVLLGKDDGLAGPTSVTYSETDGKFYVGMQDNTFKVYKVVFGSQ